MDLTLPIKVTDACAARLNAIAEAEGAKKNLRVAVLGGGCSGFSYEFTLEDETGEDDLVIEAGGAAVLIDPVSLPFLAGSVVDFKNELIGARFEVENPNATSSCGCGTSFSI
ncbi:iron-sulfur cluster insertion protein ErpA [Pikeienuella piscinae]|uniref:Iron-sulfur cluster insertion protein ErpA n=1 Tax=Pikeienuella piscinae TaxID=2748098 RepID=A0A7M3T5Z5_9RHOB|nr:iron-sulfur cluster insertion protein ErpA [Pikeienuella piscinae]QIE57426.1 iron-sulfur cluster insertion protein ErpA [Pikeienuella piscinae]